MRQAELELPGFRHEALFYRGDDEFLAGTVPMVRETADAGGAVLVAVPRGRGAALREALGADAHRVSFADMEELGRNPGRIIPAWREFAALHVGRDTPALGIGEPIWPGRTPAELVECERHETLLNLAFHTSPAWTLLCPYDAERLPSEVIDGARRNHPHVAEDGRSDRSRRFQREIPGPDALPAPESAEEIEFSAGQLRSLRHQLARRAHEAGLGDGRIADLVLAVDELATNSLRYARGRGTLRTWQEPGILVCEVTDGGHIADPLAGRELPGPDEYAGRGLYLVNQLCDLVQLRSSPEGSVVRVHMRLPAR
jgi:anti-sigma regulatory factor (Ser/Thr protein kinase)